ncbi:MAG: DUF167 domain-containing protein [Gemmatimonadales bacterium]
MSLRPTATVVRYVVPRARATQIVGRHGDAIRIRLAAPPVDGAANAELIRFLAERLGVPRRAVSIARGRTGRRKTVAIDGLATAAVERALSSGRSPPLHRDEVLNTANR